MLNASYALISMSMSMPESIHSYSRIVAPTQGILNWNFSRSPRSHSNTLLPLGMLAAIISLDSPVAILCFAPSIAALTSDPPVPFRAAKAKLAVSITASVSVALPLNRKVAVSLIEVDAPVHRGSNQSAEKSRREMTTQQRRKVQ
jgi:hypothetical protein